MSANEYPRCTFTSTNGRRCRMLCATKRASLCLPHLRKALLEQGELPPEPPPLVAPGSLDNPWAVRRSLKRIFGEAASGRMDPLMARALAHLGRLLLFSTRRPRRKRSAPRTPRVAAKIR